MTLGQFIKKIRIQKGLTQEDLAGKSNLVRSYISRLEADQFTNPSAIILIRLAHGLGIPHDTVFQIAGYIPKIKEDELLSLDAYLRAKYPNLSEQAIKQIKSYKDFVEKGDKEENK